MLSSNSESKSSLSEKTKEYLSQRAYLFLVDICRLTSPEETYLSYEKREPGYARALFSAYEFAFTNKIEDAALSHDLLTKIHNTAMSHMKQCSKQYRDKCTYFTLYPQNTSDQTATEKGFKELLEKWFLCPKKPMHVVNIKKFPKNTIFPEWANSFSSLPKVQQEIFVYPRNGNLYFRIFENNKPKEQEKKFNIGDNGYELLISYLQDPFSLVCVNSGWDELVKTSCRTNIQAIVIEKLDEIFKDYNTRIFKITELSEKLKIIVDTVQKINQVHPFLDGNIRTCKALMDRLMYQQGFSFSMMVNPNRLDCFDQEQLLLSVQEGQKAFSDLLNSKVPKYNGIDNLTGSSYEIPNEKEWVEKFFQIITQPKPVITQPKPISKKPNEILMIAPGETARLSANQASSTDLLIPLQPGRQAILFKDQEGNISLTHMDDLTDSRFASTEAKLMKSDYSVDIIKHPKSDGTFEKDTVRPAIMKSIGKTIKNSKNTDEIRSAGQGNVLIQNGKLLSPSSDWLQSSEVTEGGKLFQLRICERLLLQLITIAPSLPTLVYWNEWTGSYPMLSPAAKQFFEKASEQKGNSENLKEILVKQVCKVRGPNLTSSRLTFLLNMQHMILPSYWQQAPNDVYGNLYGFFSQGSSTQKPTIPDKAIQLITEYRGK